MFKRWSVVIIAVIIVIFALAVAGFLKTRHRENLPETFVVSNAVAVEISRIITETAANSVKKLDEIDEAEQTGNYEKALDLVIEELNQSLKMREKSLDLLVELQKMSNSVSGIAIPEAQELILQAVSNEISLVTHLLYYNEYWNQLLLGLRDKFGSANPAAVNFSAAEWIKKINDEAVTINELNRRYQSLMVELQKKV
jgi:hypothetical protein